MDDDGAVLAGHASALADAVERALAGWVVRSVERLVVAWQGDVPSDVRAAAVAAGEQARADVSSELRALLGADVEEQRTNPLSVVRRAVCYPTEVLRAAGVPPVERDEFAERAFPDDDYDLTPASFADIDPSLHEPGIVWGAAKAHVVLARRKRDVE